MPGPFSLADRVDHALDGDADDALARWAASGAMHLTGSADSPPNASPARIAPALDALAAHANEIGARLGSPVDLPGAALLGERAAIADLDRHGASSCGGSCHLLQTADGPLALSLARQSDVELLDAWLGERSGLAPDVPVADEVWASLAARVSGRSGRDLVNRATLLGLPCSYAREVDGVVDPVRLAMSQRRPTDARRVDSLTVVDFSALWAGPLCANVLGLAGARVIKVEDPIRPDGARSGPAAFYDLLHGGHESVAIDFNSPADRGALRSLVLSADVVIEASRPRALQALGLGFEAMHEAGWRGRWVSITGHGRHHPGASRVAFGDDAAVAGGLVADERGMPVFCADAVADPATGLLAAVAVLDALDAGRSGLVDVSLAGTAAFLAAGVDRHPAIDTRPDTPVAVPRARPVHERAAALGAHTDAVLRAL